LNFDNALYYFNKALNLKTDQIDKASILNNIALTYMEQQEYHKAIQISHLAQEKEVLNNTTTYSIVLDNLSYCYFKVSNQKRLPT
jgi:tetratricopeptide (TPR) repeat protein